MPGFRADKFFTFNRAHVFGDVNETSVCKYKANVKLSECVSKGKFETLLIIRFDKKKTERIEKKSNKITWFQFFHTNTAFVQ